MIPSSVAGHACGRLSGPTRADPPARPGRRPRAGRRPAPRRPGRRWCGRARGAIDLHPALAQVEGGREARAPGSAASPASTRDSWPTVKRSANAGAQRVVGVPVGHDHTDQRPAVTSATDARRARPCSGLDPVSTSRARSLPRSARVDRVRFGTRADRRGQLVPRAEAGGSGRAGPSAGFSGPSRARLALTDGSAEPPTGEGEGVMGHGRPQAGGAAGHRRGLRAPARSRRQQALVERARPRGLSGDVRNDMAALEEEGYIAQPHTSAGRIPRTRATGCSWTGCRR